MKKNNKISTFDIINNSFNVFIALLMVYPLYVIIISSVSDPSAVIKGEVYLIPKGFSLESYQNVLSEAVIWKGYRNSIIYTICGVCYDVSLAISAGYVLSKKYLPGRVILTWYFFITMFISGGMIPTYLLYKSLKLLENPLSLILRGVSCYNIIIAKNFFRSIPDSLYEAAKIDGASEFKQFFKVALPLAKPIIAVLILFQAVGHWNDYTEAMLYIHKRDLYPLQLVLREILVTNQMRLQMVTADASATQAMIEEARHLYEVAQSMRYSIVFIASAPLLIAYPFVQKYFVKGVMMGSIKE